MSEATALIQIRCPFSVTLKSGRKIPGQHFVLSAAPGSKGRAYCWKCKKNFDFNVSGEHTGH